MNLLLTIDPGQHWGWAWFDDASLYMAGVESVGKRVGDPPCPTVRGFKVLIEVPRWYPGKEKGDVNQLIDLAVQVGEFREFYRRQGGLVELVFPRTWKGTVPKEIMTARILKQLTPAELNHVPLRPRAKTPDHNTVDAIGLGLWKLGRLR